MAWKFNTIPPKRLSETINASSTSFKLSDILGFDGVALTETIIGDTGYGTFQSPDGSIVELFEFDTATIADTNGIDFVKRGLTFNEDGLFVEVSANKRTWVKGTTIVNIGTNPPALFAALKNYIDGIAIAGSPDASQATKGLVEIATAAEIDADTAIGSTGAAIATTPDQLNLSKYSTRLPSVNEKSALGAAGDFGSVSTTNKYLTENYILSGGDGSDGALTISSGTTNIDLGGVSYVERNYTSISITGTGQLTFSNPATNGTMIVLNCTGNVTVTSSTVPAISAVGCGALGGSGGTATGGASGAGGGGGAGIVSIGTDGSAGSSGSSGSDGNYGAGIFRTNPGIGGSGSTGGVAGTIWTPNATSFLPSFAYRNQGLLATCGAGGGGGGGFGGGGAQPGGNGGAGGPVLLINCFGSLNITSTISAAGSPGVAGSGAAAGGGGGGGGCIIIRYNTLVANTATLVTTGGASVDGGGAGGNGYSLVVPLSTRSFLI